MSKILLFASVLIAVAACGRPPAPPAKEAATLTSEHSELASVTVYKRASCRCCARWVEHLRRAGFSVEARNVRNLDLVRERVGVPARLAACHTAEVDGYFIEGHVPAEDIRRFVAARLDAKGLAVPGMPIGSPGMEDTSRKSESYDVLLIRPDGTTSVYAHHGR